MRSIDEPAAAQRAARRTSSGVCRLGVVFGVTSGARDPLPSAVVDSDALGQTLTDRDGRYDLRGISSARRVLLTARKSGYVTVAITMPLSSDGRADFNLIGIATDALSGVASVVRRRSSTSTSG